MMPKRKMWMLGSRHKDPYIRRANSTVSRDQNAPWHPAIGPFSLTLAHIAVFRREAPFPILALRQTAFGANGCCPSQISTSIFD